MSKRNVPGKKSMSLKETILALVALSAMTVGLQAEAEGHGPGNGGNAVLVDGKLYLLDLVEAGVEKDPYIPTLEKQKWCLDSKCSRRGFTEGQRQFLKRMDSSLDANVFDAETESLLKRKLLSLDSLVRNELLVAIGMYQWRITDLPLEKITGIRSVLDLSKMTVYQLAYRRDTVIAINRELWNRLDAPNRVALVIHEMIYAMLRPMPNGDGTFVQDSWDARLIVGNDLFTAPTDGREHLRFRTRNGVPMLSMFESTSPNALSWYVGPGDVDAAYVRADGGEVRFNPGVEIFAGDEPSTDPRSRYYASYGSPPADGGPMSYHFDGLCDSLPRFGKVSVRNIYVNAFLSFVDYRTAEGYTKAIDVKYSIRSNGYPDPVEVVSSYADLLDCRRKVEADARSVQPAFGERSENR